MIRFQRKVRGGFSLIDLLVVIAVVAFLLGLLLTQVGRIREAAARSQCQNNLRQICLATINCSDTYQGSLPPLAGDYPNNKATGTLFFHILPFIEQNNLYQSAKDEKKNYSVWNGGVIRTPLNVYTCPSDAGGPQGGVYKGWLATSNYAANFQAFGNRTKQTLNGQARFPASFTDGTSNTILFTERYQLCKGDPCAWGYPGATSWAPLFAFYSQGKFQVRPAGAECDSAVAQSPHPGGINIGMGDGSCRFLSGSVGAQTWWHACTPDGGEVLGSDWDD
jgi:prepilin-type processing-associated H-X9-DG protein